MERNLYVKYLHGVVTYCKHNFFAPNLFESRDQRKLLRILSLSNEASLILIKLFLSTGTSKAFSIRRIISLIHKAIEGVESEVTYDSIPTSVLLSVRELVTELILGYFVSSLGDNLNAENVLCILRHKLTILELREVASVLAINKRMSKSKLLQLVEDAILKQKRFKSILPTLYETIRCLFLPNEFKSEDIPVFITLNGHIEGLLEKCFILYYFSKDYSQHLDLLSLFGKMFFRPYTIQLSYKDLDESKKVTDFFFKSICLLSYVEYHLFANFIAKENKKLNRDLKSIDRSVEVNFVMSFSPDVCWKSFLQESTQMKTLKKVLFSTFNFKRKALVGYYIIQIALCLVDKFFSSQSTMAITNFKLRTQPKFYLLRVIYIASKVSDQLKLYHISIWFYSILLCIENYPFISPKYLKCASRLLIVYQHVYKKENYVVKRKAIDLVNKLKKVREKYLIDFVCSFAFRLRRTLDRLLDEEEKLSCLFPSTEVDELVCITIAVAGFSNGSKQKRKYASIVDDENKNVFCSVEDLVGQYFMMGFNEKLILEESSIDLTLGEWEYIHDEGKLIRKLLDIIVLSEIFEKHAYLMGEAQFYGHCQSLPISLLEGKDVSSCPEILSILNEFRECCSLTKYLQRIDDSDIEQEESYFLKVLLVGLSKEALVAMFSQMLTNYIHWCSGLPDLFLIKATTKTSVVLRQAFDESIPYHLLFCEVKSANDTLSDKQRMWLAFMKKHKIPSLVAKVKHN